jgi:hypothetical protein
MLAFFRARLGKRDGSSGDNFHFVSESLEQIFLDFGRFLGEDETRDLYEFHV